MQIKIFTIPLQDGERSEAEANKFLRSHRILQVERHFCSFSRICNSAGVSIRICNPRILSIHSQCIVVSHCKC